MNGYLTMTTDFGLRDPWVAELKGVVAGVWSRYPDFVGRMIDLGHELDAGDIATGSWFLQRATAGWPSGTVHLAVVDPGVGTGRPAVACRAAGSCFVGPGNGLLAFLRDRDDLEVVILDRTLYLGQPDRGGISSTFHGRDVFAPVAAHLAAGVPLGQVGTPAGAEALGSLPGNRTPGAACRIVWIDRFGNAVTDLTREGRLGKRAEAAGLVVVGGRPVPGPVETYGLAPAGEAFWYWGSGGTLEIAMRGRSAARELDLQVGLVLTVPEA